MNEGDAGRTARDGIGRAISPAGARPRPGVRVLRMSAVALGSLLAGVAVLGIRNSLNAGSAVEFPDEVVAEITGPEADVVLRALRQTATRDAHPAPEPVAEEEGSEPRTEWLLPPPPALPPLPQPTTEAEDEQLVLWRRKRESPILIYRRGGSQENPSGEAETGVQGSLFVAGAEPDRGLRPESLVGRLRTSTQEPVRAEVLADLDTHILEGTVIACILETAISSAVPGMTLCRTRIPVYSEDGQFELIPAGSRVVGEYRGGVESGQARIFVLWRRLITPDGVSVALSSPGTGPLGRGGHEGHVDQKWRERFASALMVSLVAGAGPNGGSHAAEATGAALRSTAAEAIQRELSGIPELVKLQGEPIAIIVARDLDFGVAMRRRFEDAGRRGAGVLIFDQQ